MDRFNGQPGAPSWWLGAPLIGVLFGFVANSFFPGFVASSAVLVYRLSGNAETPAALAPEATRFLAPLVGMLLAVLALATVQLVRRLARGRKRVGG